MMIKRHIPFLLAVGVSALLCCEGFVVPSIAKHNLHNNRFHVGDVVTSLTEETSELATEPSVASAVEQKPTVGSVAFLIPQSESDQQRLTKFGKSAPVERPTIQQAVQQLAQKCSWFADETVETVVVPVPSTYENENDTFLQLLETDVVVAMGLLSEDDLQYASILFQKRLERPMELRHSQCQFALDCAPENEEQDIFLPTFVGPYEPRFPSLTSVFLPWTQAASGRRLYYQMKMLFQKWNSDESVFALLIFLNQFSGHEIDWVKHSIDATWEKGPIRNALELSTMVDKCGDCIVECVQDETCRECLNTLTALDTRDQVASYRTIVSFESDLLRDFSFCILQKNNVFNCDASIPTLPKVTPIASFRGQPLTEELANSILVGHLKDESTAPQGSLGKDVSWIVACGANEAYDKFPSQNQLFYPAAKGKNMWYDPVFRVQTLDGRNVWCKRHYKVRPQKVPGTFRFSVLDNGITSDEFWTIVGVADDLSWIVFHYAGAASAVGQRYLGGLLCTPDGQLPDPAALPQVWKAIQAAGIQPWELFCVDNDTNSSGYLKAGTPPLEHFRSQVNGQRTSSLLS